MRKIKFRFGHLGEIFKVMEINFKEKKVLVDNGDWFSFDNLIEFTGLKDKNGKEIFEGDIVKAQIWSIPFHKWEKKIGEVIFHNCSFSFENKFGELIKNIIPFEDFINKTSANMIGDTNSLLEVIGNIYENPEILDLIELEREK